MDSSHSGNLYTSPVLREFKGDLTLNPQPLNPWTGVGDKVFGSREPESGNEAVTGIHVF